MTAGRGQRRTTRSDEGSHHGHSGQAHRPGRVAAAPDGPHVRLGGQRLAALERRLLLHPRRRRHGHHDVQWPAALPQHRRDGRLRVPRRRRQAAQRARPRGDCGRASTTSPWARSRSRSCEPLRVLRTSCVDDGTGLSFDLEWTAHHEPHMEDEVMRWSGGRLVYQRSNYDQCWRSGAGSRWGTGTSRWSATPGSACATTRGGSGRTGGPTAASIAPDLADDPRRSFAVRQWTDAQDARPGAVLAAPPAGRRLVQPVRGAGAAAGRRHPCWDYLDADFDYTTVRRSRPAGDLRGVVPAARRWSRPLPPRPRRQPRLPAGRRVSRGVRRRPRSWGLPRRGPPRGRGVGRQPPRRRGRPARAVPASAATRGPSSSPGAPTSTSRATPASAISSASSRRAPEIVRS